MIMTTDRLKKLRGLGTKVSYLQVGEWDTILDLASWALEQKAKAAARVAKCRQNAAARVAARKSKARDKDRTPKAAQKGRSEAKRAPEPVVAKIALRAPMRQVPLDPDLARHLNPQFKTKKT